MGLNQDSLLSRRRIIAVPYRDDGYHGNNSDTLTSGLCTWKGAGALDLANNGGLFSAFQLQWH